MTDEREALLGRVEAKLRIGENGSYGIQHQNACISLADLRALLAMVRDLTAERDAAQTEGVVSVPRKPTPQMLEAAWAEALAENAAGVWEVMIEAWLAPPAPEPAPDAEGERHG